VTSDPAPGSNGFPLPPPSPYGRPAYGPPSYGPTPPYRGGPYGPAGFPQAPYPQPGMRAAAADRERTMDILKAAFTEGRLTKEEFDARSARVLAAKTYGELHMQVADLPTGPSGVAPYHPGYYPVPVVPPSNGLAIGALVCGIAEFFTLGVAAIPAVILGHAARAQIRRTGERGDGMALTGLILGYLAIGGWALIIILLAAHS
jgi:hypothetical protein